MEVFSISGAPFGDFGAVVFSPAVQSLQNALVSLGDVAGDSMLKKVVVDGLIGPNTTAATNRALTTHIGPGQAVAELRTGTLSQDYVGRNADGLAATVGREVQRRGGVVSAHTAPKTAPHRTPPTPAPPYEPPMPSSEPSKLPWIVGGVALVGLAGFLMFKNPSMPMTTSRRRGRAFAGSDEFGAAFSRKHYTQIANLLCRHGASDDLVRGFTGMFGQDNPAFQDALFVAAARRC